LVRARLNVTFKLFTWDVVFPLNNLCNLLLELHNRSATGAVHKGFDNIKLNDFFKLSSTSLRGQNLQTTGAFGCQEIFFTVRIIDVWTME